MADRFGCPGQTRRGHFPVAMRKQSIWIGLGWPVLFVTAILGVHLLAQKDQNSPWIWAFIPILALCGWKMISPLISHLDRASKTGQPSVGAKFVRSLKSKQDIERTLAEWAQQRKFFAHNTSTAERIVYMKARFGLSPIFVILTKTEQPRLEAWVQMVAKAAPVDGRSMPLVPQKIAFADLNDLLSKLREPPISPGDVSEQIALRP